MYLEITRPNVVPTIPRTCIIHIFTKEIFIYPTVKGVVCIFPVHYMQIVHFAMLSIVFDITLSSRFMVKTSPFTTKCKIDCRVIALKQQKSK